MEEVEILVLLEGALRQFKNNAYVLSFRVEILVLLEGALRLLPGVIRLPPGR